MRYANLFQARSDKFAAAALRLGPGGGLSGFARFYAVLAEQERAIEVDEDRMKAHRDTAQEAAWVNEGGRDSASALV